MLNVQRLANYLAAKGMSTLLPTLSKLSPDILIGIMDHLSRAGIKRMSEQHQGSPEELERRVDAARGFFDMAKRKFPSLSRATQQKLAFNLFFHAIHVGDETRRSYLALHGEVPPFFLLISPSMACDLHCSGCYAWKYPKNQSLHPDKVREILREARDEMGIYFIAITGGEPTFWPHLEEIAAEFDDMFFLVYTHGQRIDAAMAKRFADLGNIYPAISIEGDRSLTDARRGEGAYDRVMSAMANLNQNGVLFGFSLTHTRNNHDYTCSDAFFNTMVAAGAAFGWVFQYIPIGREPDFKLVPTAEQRLERRERIQAVRKDKPILVFDFWNDGDAVDGCLAWGRRYLHITARGYVEPCVFVHFAKDSIHDKSLGECVRSECFREMRSRAPFHTDLRRPCPQIDHPEILKEIVAKYGLFGTHEGAEDIIGPHYDALCAIADAYSKELSDTDAQKVAAPESTCAGCLAE
ncbi:MAG: radical SAM protein [Planctomycetota bacterium]|nr:radical SAM protein [Planctomycetota bacterium]